MAGGTISSAGSSWTGKRERGAMIRPVASSPDMSSRLTVQDALVHCALMKRNPTDYLPLKPDIFDILMALESEPLHGYGIIAEVERRTEARRTLLPSLLYRRLARLAEDGVVREAEGVSDPDPRRKHYELTDFGRAVVREEARRIVALGRELAGYRWSES